MGTRNQKAPGLEKKRKGDADLNRSEVENCTVLVVEDEWFIRMELVDALADAGLTVLEAGGGEEALSYLASAGPIQVLITDIRLLGPLSGWDVADKFRDARPTIGVIYASANSPDDKRQVPGSVFFAKPTPVQRLVDVCRAWCRGDSRGSTSFDRLGNQQ